MSGLALAVVLTAGRAFSQARGAAEAGDSRIAIDRALKAGDYERAETLLLAAAEQQPPSAEVLRTLGGVLFVRGKPLNAAIAYKKAEALSPLDEKSRFTLAMAYVALARRDWARPELQRLEEAHPKTALYPYWRGRLDYDDGQHARAEQAFRRALELDPGFVKAHDNLGLVQEALGQSDEARRSFEEAARLNRLAEAPSPWPPLNLGLLLVRLDLVDAAEPLFREAVAADPRFAPARYHLGLRLERAGRHAEAVREVEEAARLDPDYAEAQYALARLYRRAGETAKADQALERFQALKKAKKKTG